MTLSPLPSDDPLLLPYPHPQDRRGSGQVPGAARALPCGALPEQLAHGRRRRSHTARWQRGQQVLGGAERLGAD